MGVYGLGFSGTTGPSLTRGSIERHAVAPAGDDWAETALCGAQVRLCRSMGYVLEYDSRGTCQTC